MAHGVPRSPSAASRWVRVLFVVVVLAAVGQVAVVQVKESRAERLLASCQDSYGAFLKAGSEAREALAERTPEGSTAAEQALRRYVAQADRRPECYRDRSSLAEVARVNDALGRGELVTPRPVSYAQ